MTPTQRSVICQTSEQKFCWWMKRRVFMKSNKDQSIAQWCSGGQQNVEGWKKFKYAHIPWGISVHSKVCVWCAKRDYFYFQYQRRPPVYVPILSPLPWRIFAGWAFRHVGAAWGVSKSVGGVESWRYGNRKRYKRWGVLPNFDVSCKKRTLTTRKEHF